MRCRLLLSAALAFGAAACATSSPAPAAPQQPPAAASNLLQDVRVLSADAMQGRLIGSPGSAKARAYIEGRLREIGLAPFRQPFTATRDGQPVKGMNLLALVEGTSNSERTMVVMAHYDHVGVREGQIYNGADDNASGVAALLAIAESLKAQPPSHDVLLVFTDGEEEGQENGGSGAEALIAGMPVPLTQVALAVNFDMLSKNARGELYVAGAHHFPRLKPRLEAIAAGAPVSLKLGHDSPAWGESQDWTRESDHRVFHDAGVPWVYFGVEDHPEYHQPTDDFVSIPQDFFRRSAQTVLQAVRTFDRDLDAIAAEAGR